MHLRQVRPLLRYSIFRRHWNYHGEEDADVRDIFQFDFHFVRVIGEDGLSNTIY